MPVDLNEKNILIISNNPLDIHGANGKTLESFFIDQPQNCLAQLYLNNEIPNSRICKNFYHITERDIIKKILHKQDICGSQVKRSNEYENISNQKSSFNNKKIPINNVTRLCRELIWKTKIWENSYLEKWVLDFDPDIIFFCAGDSCFAYDIASYVQHLTNSSLVTYLTDDYILPRFNLSLPFWIRRNWILKKMKKVIHDSDKFMTISEPMHDTYLKIFKKDSFVASNMTESLKENYPDIDHNEKHTIVYTGGIHYGRYETLIEVGKAIRKYNESHFKKAILNIYCPQAPSEEMISKLNIENGSHYCGSLNQKQLKKVLNTCDFPLHVESFLPRNISMTRLSISTKITEYLSLGKCIIAVGPPAVASMQLLKDYGYCIVQQDLIYHELTNLLENDGIINSLAERAEQAYETKYNSTIVRNDFLNFINQD